MEQFQWLQVLYLIGVLALVGPAVWVVSRRRPGVLRYVTLWLAIAVAVAVAYRLFEAR